MPTCEGRRKPIPIGAEAYLRVFSKRKKGKKYVVYGFTMPKLLVELYDLEKKKFRCISGNSEFVSAELPYSKFCIAFFVD